MCTFCSNGSSNQPNWATLSMYYVIFSRTVERRSDLERNSTTKSGQIGANSLRSASVNASQRSRRIQETSGERLAPLGSVKPVEESKPTPVPSVSTHLPNRTARVKLRLPPSETTGGIIIISPSLFISTRSSGCSAQNSANSTSVKRSRGAAGLTISASKSPGNGTVANEATSTFMVAYLPLQLEEYRVWRTHSMR